MSDGHIITLPVTITYFGGTLMHTTPVPPCLVWASHTLLTRPLRL